MHFDDFTFDAGSRRLLRGGNEIRLTPKAFRLLELLISHRPDAVSKASIQDAIWPSTHVVEANIANLIGEIRTALNDHESRYVQTVPRFGYRFTGGDQPRDQESLFTLVLGEVRCKLRPGINELGRSSEYNGLFDSPTVSRRHARIVIRGGSAQIEDLDSKNGTFVGNVRVAGSIGLKDGDVVRLGDAAVTFRVSDETSTRTLPEE